MKADWRAKLEIEYEAGQAYKPNKADWLDGAWSGLRTADNADEQRRGKTAVPAQDPQGNRQEAGDRAGRVQHPQNRPFASLKPAPRCLTSGEGLDWATGRSAGIWVTLVLDGHKIRLSGQDCERGTFSQRHSVLYDQDNEDRYIPLANLSPNQAPL